LGTIWVRENKAGGAKVSPNRGAGKSHFQSR
jgi:hypothetical protein